MHSLAHGDEPRSRGGKLLPIKEQFNDPAAGNISTPPPGGPSPTHAQEPRLQMLKAAPPRPPQVIGSSEMNNHAHAPSETVGRGACACFRSVFMEWEDVPLCCPVKNKEAEREAADSSRDKYSNTNALGVLVFSWDLLLKELTKYRIEI